MSIDLSEGDEKLVHWQRFEKVAGTACKFYEVSLVKILNPVVWNVESNYGSMKAGAHVATVVKSFSREQAAWDEFQKITAVRHSHGYREVK